MGKQLAGSPTTAYRELRAQAASRAVMEASNGEGGGRDTARREMIASTIREWVVPVLVRKFLNERASRPPVANGNNDVPGSISAANFGVRQEADYLDLYQERD